MYIYSGVGINKNYIFHNFKFHVYSRVKEEIFNSLFSNEIFKSLFFFSLWNNGLAVKALDFESWCPVFKTTGRLQGRLSFSSFRGP